MFENVICTKLKFYFPRSYFSENFHKFRENLTFFLFHKISNVILSKFSKYFVNFFLNFFRKIWNFPSDFTKGCLKFFSKKKKKSWRHFHAMCEKIWKKLCQNLKTFRTNFQKNFASILERLILNGILPSVYTYLYFVFRDQKPNFESAGCGASGRTWRTSKFGFLPPL